MFRHHEWRGRPIFRTPGSRHPQPQCQDGQRAEQLPKTKGLPEKPAETNSQTDPPTIFVRKLAHRPSVVTPPAIWCDRASKQRPEATSQVAQKRIKSQAKSGQSCCGQAACATERASLAACGRPAFATGLEDRRTSQKHTSAFLRFRIKMVEESWLRNGLEIWPTRQAAHSNLERAHFSATNRGQKKGLNSGPRFCKKTR
jgi:hypothetical protein